MAFIKACKTIRESLYGVLIEFEDKSIATGTAFMVAPGICATCAHNLYRDGKIHNGPPDSKGIHVSLTLDLSSMVSTMRTAKVLAIDSEIDLALIEIINPTSTKSVSLLYSHERPGRGTNFGTLGFPLSDLYYDDNNSSAVSFSEQFLEGYLSGFPSTISQMDRSTLYSIYAFDRLCYPGESGAPAFTDDAIVLGMMAHSGRGMKSDGTTFSDGLAAISYCVPSATIISLAQEHGLGNKLNLVSR